MNTQYQDSQSGRAARRAYEIITRGGGAPVSLAALAQRVGLSPFHLQRAFKSRFGLSPKALQQQLRMAQLRQELKSKARASDAIFDAGFGSGSSESARGISFCPASRFGLAPITLTKLGQKPSAHE